MRAFILLLIAILVFVGCAVVGFYIARNLNPSVASTEGSVVIPSLPSEQHNYMVIRVDNLSAANPKLISVWYTSLYFVNKNPNSLTLAQIYPPRVPSQNSALLERTFALSQNELSQNGKPVPVQAFWDSVKRYRFKWEGYIIFDTEGANLFLQWLVGPTDFIGALDEAAQNQDNSHRMAEQICQSIIDSSGRSLAEFNWSQVADHFDTSLGLPTGLDYWDRMTDPSQSVTCEFLPSP